MLTRRHILGAIAALPTASWAAAGSPAFVAAAQEPSGDYALFGLSAQGDQTFRIPLPARGHAAAAHPTRAEAVAFARRPGRFALVLDCAQGQVLHRLEPPSGHHFYGHGAFLSDGRLVTTENHIDTGQGRIGLWSPDYRRMATLPSGGIGPHEVIRIPGTDRLAIANGGIHTHPDRGREKLNLDTMRPNLSYMENGEITESVELPSELHQASIRHLAARPDGTVAFAMQWQGDEYDPVPLLGLHRSGTPQLLSAPEPEQLALRGYVGSVAFSGNGEHVAITGPRGGVAHIYDVASGTHEVIHRPDICGTAPLGTGLAFTDGKGAVMTPAGPKLHLLRWDNHLVPLG